MKKRILSYLLTVAMIVCFIPVFEIPAMAAVGEAMFDLSTMTAPTKSCSHSKGLSGSINTYSMKGSESYYYLTGDVTTSDTMYFNNGNSNQNTSSTVVLCLNGYNYNYTGDDYAFRVGGSGGKVDFYIVDCQETVNEGYIDANDKKWKSDAKAPERPEGSIDCDLTGGTITASGSGGLFYVQAGSGKEASVNLISGNIAGSNLSKSNNSLIWLYGGIFNMAGGTITGNAGDYSLMQIEDAYYVMTDTRYFGQFNMYGGKVQYNSIDRDVNDNRLINVDTDSFANLMGGEIKYNSVLDSSGELYRDSAIIYTINGGILQLWDDPQITNNKGLAIFAMDTVYVSGTPKVINNTDQNGTPTNVGLYGGSRMTMGVYSLAGYSQAFPAVSPAGELNDGTELGVTLKGGLPESKTALFHALEEDLVYVSCDHNTPSKQVYEIVTEDMNPPAYRAIVFKKLKPSVAVTPIDDEIVFGDFSDDNIAKYRIDLVNYEQADLEVVDISEENGNNYIAGTGTGSGTNVVHSSLGYSGFYNISYEKVSDTQYIMTIKPDEEKAIEYINYAYPPLYGAGEHTLKFFDRTTNLGSSETKRGEFTLNITKGTFAPAGSSVTLLYEYGSTATWTPAAELPYGIEIERVIIPEEASGLERTEEDLGGGNSIWYIEPESGQYTFKAKRQLEEGVDANYYDCTPEYKCMSMYPNCYNITPGAVRVNIQYPGVLIVTDEATKENPSYDAVYDDENGGSTEYTVSYVGVDDNDIQNAKIYWTDSSGNELTENIPDENLISLSLTDNNTKAIVTNQRYAPAGDYYFVVEAGTEKTDVVTYTIDKATFGDDPTENTNTVIELISTVDTAGKFEEVDLTGTSGGSFTGTPTLTGDPAPDWFDFEYTALGGKTLKVTATIEDAGSVIPPAAEKGIIEVEVTGSPNYKDYTHTFTIEPVFKSVRIESSSGSMTYGTPSDVENVMQYIALDVADDQDQAEFTWVTDGTGEEETTAPQGMSYEFGEDFATLTVSSDGTTPAGTYYYKVSVTEGGGSTYSLVREIVVAKAEVPGSIKTELEGKLLFLKDSELIINLEEAEAIVEKDTAYEGVATVKTNTSGWDATVVDNIFRVTNSTEIPSATPAKTIVLEVTSNNYVTYEVEIEVIPLYKEVNVVEDSVDISYGTDGNAVFTVSNTQLVDAPVTVEWDGVKPDGVIVKLDGTEVSDVIDPSSPLLIDGEQTLTVSIPSGTPAGDYTFNIAGTDNTGTYSTEVTFTVAKASFDPDDQEATISYKAGSNKVFTGMIPSDIAVDKNSVLVETSSTEYTVSYDKDNNTITVTCKEDLAKNSGNLPKKTVVVDVKGGATANYENYSFEVEVTPDFKVIDEDQPDVSIPDGTTNTLKIINKSGVSFRITEETLGFDSGWTVNSGTFVIEPLAAGNYIVEACYTNLLYDGEIPDAYKEQINTTIGTYTVSDAAAIDTIDLYEGDAMLSTTLNSLFDYMNDPSDIPDAKYVKQNGEWKKLLYPGKLNVITSADCANNLVNGDLRFGAIELTLKDVTTTGEIEIDNLDKVSIIIDGEVSVGVIHTETDLLISGGGAAEKDSLTIGSEMLSCDGSVTVKNFDAFNATGEIYAYENVNIDGNGDAVIVDGKDTNTDTNAVVNLFGYIYGEGSVNIDGIKKMLIVSDNYSAIVSENDILITNVGELGINAEYDPNDDPVMDVCTYGIVADDTGSITLVDVDKFNIYVDEMGLVANEVELNGCYGVISAVATSGDEESVYLYGSDPSFIILNKTAVVKSGEDKSTAKVIELGKIEIDSKEVKALVEDMSEIGAYLVISAPSSATGSKIPVSNDESEIGVDVTVTGSDAKISSITDEQLDMIISDKNAAGDVVIDVSGIKNTEIDCLIMPVDVLEKITAAAEAEGNDTEHLVIKLSTAELKIDDKAMRALIEQANGNVIRFHFEDVGLTRMNKTQKSAVEAMDVHKGFEAYITVNGVRIGDFRGGEVELLVPFALPEGHDVQGFTVWYVDENGGLEKLPSTYDGVNKWFVVKHFSDYVIVYGDYEGDVHNCPKDETCPIHPYSDTDKKEWYHDGVHYCISEGLMKGISNTEFAPGVVTNRAMIATILWRMEGSPVIDYTMTFKDVAEGQWYEEAIRWAQSAGVVEGYDADTFGPDDSITREQMATILYRYCQYKGIDVSVGESTNILSYEDALSVSEWAVPALQWACGSGMIKGIEENGSMYLDPQGDAVRSQSATMFYRFCTEIKK